MSSPAIPISFGKGHLSVQLPDGARPTVIRKTSPAKIADPRQAIRDVLDRPMGARPFRELARGRRSACILICDITRPVPNHLFLRPMIEDLLAAGIPAAKICVLVATGLHRPNEGAELAELVGDPWVQATVRVENHFARNDADHVDLGPTRTRGTPVKIDRLFMEADLKIATGLVEPHFMAGYSGGRKVVAPGAAHADTIRTFHSARFMEDPFAASCNLAGNPLHEEQLEIIRMIGEVYGLNTVIDEQRDLIHVTFGEIIVSHLAAVEFIRGITEINLPRRFHTIVTSAAGYPLDKTYYQTVKGMVTPIDILAPGGTLIIASECSEGLGSPEFHQAQSRLVDLGTDAFLQALLRKPMADVDEWQTEMQIKPMRIGRVQLYTSGLSDEERRVTGVEVIDSIDRAVGESISRSDDSDVAIIPEGPYVVPFFRPAADAALPTPA
jgi:nickel-dependent lactate racemase